MEYYSTFKVPVIKEIRFDHISDALELFQIDTYDYKTKEKIYLFTDRERIECISKPPYYHYSINGIGWYEALKNKLKYQWNLIKDEYRFTWLSCPDMECKDNHESWLTDAGNKKFKEFVYPYLTIFFHKNDIKLEIKKSIPKNAEIVHEDKYHIVICKRDTKR